MKLIHLLTLRMAALKAILLAFWAVLFYFAIIDEINDETDDALEDYAETMIRKSLAGESLPDTPNGSNNQFYINKVSDDYAARTEHIRYGDMEVYIKEKKEFEPARTISYIYQDDNGQYNELVVFTPTIDKDDLKHAIFTWLVVLFAGLLLCMVAVNWQTLRRCMRPLHALLAWLDDYRIGRPGQPMSIKTNISEFEKLTDTVQRSVRRNEESYEQQKLFIANASHEIQTPLAVAQSRLEMLIDDDTLSERQMGEIVKTMHTLKNLSRINRSLLLLCKIDNGQFADATTVDFGGIAARQLPDFEDIYAHRGITANIGQTGKMTMTMNESLASTLTANLIKNAFVHNTEGGSVTIHTTQQLFRIENTGQPEPLDESKIFERFYHSPEKTTSTGLGLSIVKAICNLYGISITYRFGNNRHVFELSIK